jgi:hypothetical protein
MVELAVKDINGDMLTGGQILVWAIDQPQRRQCRPDLGDRSPAVTVTQTRHTRPFPGCLAGRQLSVEMADEAKTG